MSRLRLWLIVFSAIVFSGAAAGQTSELPFLRGEQALYGAYYNLGFLWVQSGEVEFKTDTVRFQQQKAWHLKAVGKSLKAYDLFYFVRDTFETFSTFETFKPLYSRRILNHAKESSVHQYWFDYRAGTIRTHIRQTGQQVFSSTVPVQENTFDILATAYNFRKYDFNKLFVGQKVPYRMLVDRQLADLYFRYLGTENVKTRNGREFRCHKVSVYLIQGDFFPEGEYMKIWFTDDKNHLPVQVETKILVGSIKALLLNVKALKYPLTSEIKN